MPGVGRVVAAELDENVVDALKKNIDLNGPDAKEKVRAIHTDVRLHMLQNPGVSLCGFVGIAASFKHHRVSEKMD